MDSDGGAARFQYAVRLARQSGRVFDVKDVEQQRVIGTAIRKPGAVAHEIQLDHFHIAQACGLRCSMC